MAEEELDWNKTKKYHEGWIHHQPVDKKDWSKFWVVLRGNILFIFKNNKTSNLNSHVGTLTLAQDTEIKSLDAESSKKKGFKFELVTTSVNGQRKINRFKLDKENDRDVWKSYLSGIALGMVPRDVHLLPGQLKDIMEAIGDHQNTPPALPTLPRVPNHPPRGTTRSGGSAGSADSGSFRSHVTANPSGQRKMSSGSSAANEGTVNNLRQLYRRQSEMAYKALGDQDDNGNYPMTPSNMATNRSKNSAPDTDDDGLLETNIVWSEFSFGKPDEKLQDKSSAGRKQSLQEERKVEKNPLEYLFGGPQKTTERAKSP